MKKTISPEYQASAFQESDSKINQEEICHRLREIHSQMIKFFNVNFPFFRDVLILQQSEFKKHLTRRIRSDLRSSGITKNNIQWIQISKALTCDQTAGLSNHFAFYNPQNETLYLNEEMTINFPEKVVLVCAHELAEKLLASLKSTTQKTSTENAVRLYFEAKGNFEPIRLQQILDLYFEAIFKTVFKEGSCEAIALQTLKNMNYAEEAALSDKELQTGYLKCIGLLSSIETRRKNIVSEKTFQTGLEESNSQKILEEVLKHAQIIKGASYYLGYPLARKILEKYGINGIHLAVQRNLPLEAKYFANPDSYLELLENKLSRTNEERGF